MISRYLWILITALFSLLLVLTGCPKQNQFRDPDVVAYGVVQPVSVNEVADESEITDQSSVIDQEEVTETETDE